MSTSLKNYIYTLLLVLVLIIINACDSKQKQETTDTEPVKIESSEPELTKTHYYDNWDIAEFENIKIIYQPDHPFLSQMNDFAIYYKTVLRRSAEFFRLNEPTDSIVIFYYTGFGQGQDLGQTELPTVRGDTVHYWTGNKFGITSAMYMLNKWSSVESKHKFLYHGMMRLLDASGRNYHAQTYAYIDSAKFITLSDLVTDVRIDFNWETYQSGEAASFVDYFVYKYGIEKFKQLYESQLSFDSSIQNLCNIQITTLEKNWLQVAQKASKPEEQNK